MIERGFLRGGDDGWIRPRANPLDELFRVARAINRPLDDAQRYADGDGDAGDHVFLQRAAVVIFIGNISAAPFSSFFSVVRFSRSFFRHCASLVAVHGDEGRAARPVRPIVVVRVVVGVVVLL